MNYHGFKVWLITTVTLLVLAVAIILTYWIRRATSWDGFIMLVLLAIAVAGIYAVAIRYIVHPDKRLVDRIWFKATTTTILTFAMASGVIHYLRFVPSPEGATTYSRTVATLLTLSGFSAYLLLNVLLWKGLKK